ncbi:hypothetical protein ACN42_g11210 [Penicillium freii]|uniref:Carrier domain-containing protein n=1 Tax=Penicillium freii TaxID=48697 RepID=A0A101M8T2_PENFR|nr:hypothetical protein ACN42_g11210 [Penicillium freii]
MMLGVQLETIVPIYMDKSRWTTVAILAVMKSGAAFTLLDPSHPPSRLQTICQEINSKFILTSEERSERSSHLAPSLVIEHLAHVCRSASGQSGVFPGHPDGALYVTFTSGSTGKPKGVVIEHESYCSGAQHHLKAFRICRESRVLQFASYAFDVSLMETLSTLMAGACLCVMSNDQRTDPVLFQQAFDGFEVTHAFLTPSFARTIAWTSGRPGTTTLVLGGETMRTSDVSFYNKLGISLMNAYGPAECSVNSTVLSTVLPTGRPNNIGLCTGAVAWIVNPDDPEQQIPHEEVGELLIEGPIVGRGYLNNPEATREVFIRPPLWLERTRAGVSGTIRTYLTGDLASIDTNSGEILIHGRKDHQVKIRGQRVELGEIETHLCDCFSTMITEVVVERITPQNNEQDKLIAFLVLPPSLPARYKSTGIYENLFYSPQCATMELFHTSQQRLKERLPDYMVPNTFIPLVMLPKVPSGKIDRNLLRATALGLSRDQMQEYNLGSKGTRATKEPPTTQKEELLRRLYSETLGLSPELIGMRDTFLQLGGDSLLAIRLVGAARKTGLFISMQDILSTKITVSEQAERATECISLVDLDMHGTPAFMDKDTRAEVMQAMENQHGIRPQEVEDVYPCTSLQEGMFATSIKTSGMYMGDIVLQVQDDVDPVLLKSGWKAITTANPILRTRIVSTTKGLMQVVLLDDFTWEESMRMEQSPGSPQDSSPSTNGCLVRFKYIHPTRELTVTIHHSIWDGWSLQLVQSQFQDAYEGISLAKLPFSPFVHYTQHLQGVEEFWASELSGLDAPVFPALPSSNYCPSATGALEHVIQNLDTTGMPGIETIVGPTIATIPLRVKVNRDESLKSALDDTQDILTRIIPHEQAGLPRISRCSADAARACNFQTQLIIEAASGREGQSNSGLLAVSSGSTSTGMSYSRFTDRALMIVFHPSLDRGTISINVAFETDILSSTEVNRMMSQYENILRQIYKTSSATPGNTQMASPSDLLQLQSWNQEMPLADARCLPELVLAQSAWRTHEVAVCSWDGSWTYDELVSHSLRLSHHLKKLQVHSGSFVSICLERSKWSIAAIIAVHLSGGTCILLDPDHPRQRLQHITEHAGSSVMINSEATTASSGDICAIEVRLTEPFLNSLEESGDRSFKGSPEDPAFIMFTSGSTGQPKGIVMSHRALSSSIHHNSNSMMFHPGTRALHFSSYAFDVSIYEIFTTLAAGGTVCVPSEFERKNCLAEVIRRMDVNWAFLTPTTVQTISPSEVPSLTTLVLGGEAVTRDNADTWASGRSLINGYGPAEATICGVGPIPEGRWKSGVIGRIVGGLGWVTEPTTPGRLVAVGAVGELLLEGPFLAHGYLNLPDVTRRSFIKCPAWRSQIRSDTPSVVYRTGDLVKYQPDGTIQYIGRKDTRTKLRGQLIDLGEVETAVLRIFPNAVEVVAEVMEMSTTATLLIAWIKLSNIKVPEDMKNSDRCIAPAVSEFINASSLVQTRLRELLPSYMVPTMLLPVWRIPHTLTGKADRRCLRKEVQDLLPSEIQSFMVAPHEKEHIQNKSEELLRDIWADLLEIMPDTIGRQDSFLLVGGDSITAMKMMAVARSAGFGFTVIDVLNSSPLSNLAATRREITPPIEPSVFDPNSVTSEPKQEVAVSSDANSTAPFPVTGAQDFLIKRYPWSHFRFSFDGNIDQNRLRSACDLILRSHSILRTAFVEDNGQLKQAVRDSTNNVPFRTFVTDESLETFAVNLCNAEQLVPVPAVDHPALFTLVSNKSLVKHEFIMRLAHAQYDAVSLPRVLADFEAIFKGTGTVASSDFRQHLTLLSQQDLGKAYEFWKTYLQGTVMTSLPSSFKSPPSGSFHQTDPITVAGTYTVPLPPIPSEITLATVVKAASCLVLAHFSGTNDIVLGQTVSGRSLIFDEFDDIVGPCTNYIPYRVVLNPSMTAIDYLIYAQAQHSRCLKYESIDLSQIVKNCTEWAQTTEFTVIVQHQLSNTHLDLTLDGNKSTAFSLSGRLIPSSEIWICSTSSPAGIKIEVFGSSSSIEQENAELLAFDISTAVHRLLSGVHDLLSSVYGRNV